MLLRCRVTRTSYDILQYHRVNVRLDSRHLMLGSHYSFFYYNIPDGRMRAVAGSNDVILTVSDLS
ncbi:hypothetical protein E2C01_048926 [Portunus trituberculatus]|uniref:Uncharacterized protein n=1 Tax=Portunus trituberculatus TaxID=210409 RepID=A0A5B7GCB5_PORTR|nr:hypothetical protein [Portunus trituberculatus]